MATEPAQRATREEILRATGELIAEAGFPSPTTRAIAKRARCAEGSIYRYFPDKHALIHAVMIDRFESFFALVEELPARAGMGTVAGSFVRIGLEALRFYRGIAPLIGAQLADPRLLRDQRDAWERGTGGPVRALRAVRDYVVAEQRLGRIVADAEPDLLGRELLGTCFAHAILETLVGDAGRAEDRSGRPLDDEPFVRMLVASILAGAEPTGPAPAIREQPAGPI